MKKFILVAGIAGLLVVVSNGWSEEEMVPLREHYNQTENVDESDVYFYINARCSALNKLIAERFTLGHKEEHKKYIENANKMADEFLLQAGMVRSSLIFPDEPLEESYEAVGYIISEMINAYRKSLNEFYVYTGQGLPDWMGEDITFCDNEVYSTIQK